VLAHEGELFVLAFYLPVSEHSLPVEGAATQDRRDLALAPWFPIPPLKTPRIQKPTDPGSALVKQDVAR